VQEYSARMIAANNNEEVKEPPKTFAEAKAQQPSYSSGLSKLPERGDVNIPPAPAGTIPAAAMIPQAPDAITADSVAQSLNGNNPISVTPKTGADLDNQDRMVVEIGEMLKARRTTEPDGASTAELLDYMKKTRDEQQQILDVLTSITAMTDEDRKKGTAEHTKLLEEIRDSIKNGDNMAGTNELLEKNLAKPSIVAPIVSGNGGQQASGTAAVLSTRKKTA